MPSLGRTSRFEKICDEADDGKNEPLLSGWYVVAWLKTDGWLGGYKFMTPVDCVEFSRFNGDVLDSWLYLEG